MVPAVIPRVFEPTSDSPCGRRTTRRQHSRIVTRCQTDLTDAEWRVIALLLPKPSATRRPREWPMREIHQRHLPHARTASGEVAMVADRFMRVSRRIFPFIQRVFA